MSLVSSEPIVLIGPGSEWFWSAAQLVVVAVTLFGIYYQLRGQRAANALHQLRDLGERRDSERMRTVRLRVLTGLKSGDDADTDQLVADVVGFFEEVAFLHRQDYLETELLFSTHDLGIQAVRYWTILEPVVRKYQATYGAFEGAGFERLAREMRAVMSAKGILEFKTDPQSVAERIDFLIEGGLQWARLEKELTAGGVRPLTTPSQASADAD